MTCWLLCSTLRWACLYLTWVQPGRTAYSPESRNTHVVKQWKGHVHNCQMKKPCSNIMQFGVCQSNLKAQSMAFLKCLCMECFSCLFYQFSLMSQSHPWEKSLIKLNVMLPMMRAISEKNEKKNEKKINKINRINKMNKINKRHTGPLYLFPIFSKTSYKNTALAFSQFITRKSK